MTQYEKKCFVRRYVKTPRGLLYFNEEKARQVSRAACVYYAS
jgi:hypothetical protein